MKDTPIQEAFPDALSEHGWFSCPTREALLGSLGLAILATATTGDYSGETFLLVLDPQGTRFGFLSYYYGSCSGCDDVEAASSYEDAEVIRRGLRESIHWVSTATEMRAYLNSAEWAASCGGDDSASYRDIMLKGLERCYEHDDRMGDEVLARACFARSQAEGLL